MNARLLKRVNQALGSDCRLYMLAEIARYPILLVRWSLRDDVPIDLLTGGTHGDELAGVEAALNFLQRDVADWLAHLSFEVLICLNVHGYVHNNRHNAQDVDVNGAWSGDDVPEVRVIKHWVRDQRFKFVCDFHEDWESPGFYLYEMRRGAPLMGTNVVNAVERICSLNPCDQIEGLSAVRGVVLNDEKRENELRGEVIPIELYHSYTDHSLSLESPTERRMDVRVAAHIAALDIVVAVHLPPPT